MNHDVINEKEQNAGLSEELLKNLVQTTKKQLFYLKLNAIISCGVAVVLIICLLVFVPSVVRTVNQANEVMAQASETIVLADSAIESVTEMSQAITTMGNNMDTFISDNAQSVQQVMKKLDEIDFEGLNSAIKDLGDVVEPLANFFGRFK